MSDSNLPVKIMSFNISSGLRLDGRLDLELTASVIEEADVDIAGLQEVDQNFSERSDFVDQIKWLANRLNMHAAFGPNVTANATGERNQEQAYGNAILSRHPIQSYRNHQLKKLESEKESEQRGLLEAIIEIEGIPIAFFTTHLSLKEKQLAHNVEELLEIIRQEEMPAILTGDFNANPDNPHMLRIADELNNVFGTTALHPITYKKQGDHGKRIDFIFSSEHWRVLSADKIETEASDHRPIFALLQLDPEA
ncbi:endonuclease/exonuclease/phosphatase family protein [Metaplanococcus flavidus]|uniref:Endonuclease/exonuclease/phosphatase family protein n=1 Tax=Metaplanococcus flavidus TaxID=569883 RepID=A0ABW3LH63_9BACL